jgi:hypothetical protein
VARGGGFQCKLQALLLEWVGPYDDEKLGFHKVAKYMHVPGVLELEANTDLYINKARWAEQPVAPSGDSEGSLRLCAECGL